MAPNKDISGDVNFDSQNIFDELSWAQEVWDEVQKIEETENKDMFFYLKKFNTFSFFLNIILFLSIWVWSLYVYVQSQEEKKAYPFLTPICSLFLWNIDTEENNCYGINSIFSDYEEKVEELKIQQAEQIAPLLSEVYTIENFSLSPKIAFLLEKTETRLRPLEIIMAFDEMKNIFAPIDKKELRCYNMKISQGDILDVTCDAFSSDWDTSIVNLWEGDSISPVNGGGTSISKASSFIYFLENHSKSKFQVISKPDTLSKQEVQELPYTQITTIHLELRYTNLSNLSF